MKGGIEWFSALPALSGTRRWFLRSRSLILAYHNVVPNDDPLIGDSSLHLPIDRFRRQLDFLEDNFEIVSLKASLTPSGPKVKPTVSITFDDAYLGCLELGLPELVQRGIEATVFVPPGLLGSSGYWWDRISHERMGGIHPEIRERCLWEFGGDQAKILSWARSIGRLEGPPPELYRPGSESDMDRAGRLNGISLGSHTWSHMNLAGISHAEAREELSKANAWLQNRPEYRDFSVVSYPYGAYHAETPAVVKTTGHDAAFRITGGHFHPSDADLIRFTAPRMNISRNLTIKGFSSRVSGTWPL